MASQSIIVKNIAPQLTSVNNATPQDVGVNNTNKIIMTTDAVWGEITGTLSDQTDLNTALAGKQTLIDDLSTIRAGAALGATAIQTETDPIYSASVAASITSNDIINWNSKQSAISDLEEIRAGAELGSTALQSVPSEYRTSAVQDAIDSRMQAAIDSKYTLPSTGIPASVLTVAVQSSLAKADSAIQQDALTSALEPYLTIAAQSAVDAAQNSAISAKYVKPSTGIPASDLDSTSRTYLALASTALQSETDPIFSASAAFTISSSDISSWNGKSVVSASSSGSATDVVNFLTINGTEKKIGGDSVTALSNSEIDAIFDGVS